MAAPRPWEPRQRQRAPSQSGCAYCTPFHLFDRRIENEGLPACRKYGTAVIPWSASQICPKGQNM